MSAAAPPEPSPPEPKPDAGTPPSPEPQREHVELAVARAGARATVTTAALAAVAALLGAAIGAGATYLHDTSQFNESEHARLRMEVTTLLNDQTAVDAQEQAYSDAVLIDNPNKKVTPVDVRTVEDRGGPRTPPTVWPAAAIAKVREIQKPFSDAAIKVDADVNGILAENPMLGVIAGQAANWDHAVASEVEAAVLTGASHPDSEIAQNHPGDLKLGRPRYVTLAVLEGMQRILNGESLDSK